MIFNRDLNEPPHDKYLKISIKKSKHILFEPIEDVISIVNKNLAFF